MFLCGFNGRCNWRFYTTSTYYYYYYTITTTTTTTTDDDDNNNNNLLSPRNWKRKSEAQKIKELVDLMFDQITIPNLLFL